MFAYISLVHSLTFWKGYESLNTFSSFEKFAVSMYEFISWALINKIFWAVLLSIHGRMITQLRKEKMKVIGVTIMFTRIFKSLRKVHVSEVNSTHLPGLKYEGRI